MDFHQLLARMQELDRPVVEKETTVSAQTEECGGEMNTSMPALPPKADEPPPSISVNMNAQGMDNISDLMKLLLKVNPDMMPKEPSALPNLNVEPAITAAGPTMPALKMIPDMDNDSMHSEPDGDEIPSIKGLDRDDDGDHDMGDHEIEPKDKDDKKEWANDPDPELRNTDYMINKLSGGLGRQQNMHPHNYRGGDNPMSMTRESLQASIKAELQQRLEEAKAKTQKK